MSKIKAIVLVVILVGGAGAGALLGLNQFFQRQLIERTEQKLTHADKDFIKSLRIRTFETIEKISPQIRNLQLSGPLVNLYSHQSDRAGEVQNSLLKIAHGDLVKVLTKLQKEANVPGFVVVSRTGQVIARVPEADKFGDSLNGLPATKECLAGTSRDALYELDGKLVQIAAVPILGNQTRPIGCLMALEEFGTTTIKLLAEQMGMEATLFLRAAVKATTQEASLVKPLEGQLNSGKLLYFGKSKTAFPFLFDAQQGHFVAKIFPLVSGSDSLHVALILPLAPLVEPLHQAQQTLFIGLGALFILGLLFGLLLTGRSKEAELLKLRDSVKLLASGSLGNFSTDGYQGVCQELALDISRLADNRSRISSSMAPVSVSDVLGGPQAEPIASAQDGEQAAGDNAFDFESLLGQNQTPAAEANPANDDQEALDSFFEDPSSAVVSEPSPADELAVVDESEEPTMIAPELAIPPSPEPAPAFSDEEEPAFPEPPPTQPGPGPKVDLPGDLAEIFGSANDDATREVEPIIPPQARPGSTILPENEQATIVAEPGESPEFLAPAASPAPPPTVDEFDVPEDMELDEEQGEFSDFQPDATVIAQVPEELLQAASAEPVPEPVQQPVIPPPPAAPESVAIPQPPVPTPPATTGSPAAGSGADSDHFQEVFNKFLATKQDCGEATAGLSFDRFADKLTKNTSDLKARYQCRSVKFQVYVKNGKAALRATPIK